MRWAEDLSGKTFAICGEVSGWSPFYGSGPEDAVRRRGARVVASVGEGVDYLVVGSGRKKGRADAIRKGKKLAASGKPIEILDEAALYRLLRIDLKGATMFFAGGFERSDPAVPESQPAAVAASVGAVPVDDLDERVEFAVIGPKRAAGKAAAKRTADALIAAGHPLIVVDEAAFYDMLLGQARSGPTDTVTALLVEMNTRLEPKRVRRAVDMLKGQSFRLYADPTSERLVGVVRGHHSTNTYSNAIYPDGRYSCCSQDLDPCMGMQGTVCKHLMVLMLGLGRAGQIDIGAAIGWVQAAAARRPAHLGDLLAETLVRYKGAEAGEVDWRPTETLPEDFYAL